MGKTSIKLEEQSETGKPRFKQGDLCREYEFDEKYYHLEIVEVLEKEYVYNIIRLTGGSEYDRACRFNIKSFDEQCYRLSKLHKVLE